QFTLPGVSLLAELCESACKHHRGPEPVRRPFLQRSGNPVRWNREHCALWGLRQRGECRVSREACHFQCARVNRKDAAGVAEPTQVHHDVVTEGILAWRGADDRNGAWREER